MRRVAFYDTDSNFYMNPMHVAQWDASQVTALSGADTDWATTGIAAWKNEETNYSVIPYKEKKDPMNGWAVPFVTGHKYMIWWTT